MRKLLLTLSAIAVSAMAFATPKATTVTDLMSTPRAIAGKENPKMVKYSEGKRSTATVAPTTAVSSRADAETITVKVNAKPDDNNIFEGWVLFLSEEKNVMAYFPTDEETWEYYTEAEVELPAGKYDVLMRYQRMEPIATSSLIVKEQVELTDGMEITMDPSVCTYKVKGALTNPEGKLISPGLEGADGSVVEEQTVLYFENEVGLLPTFTHFIISGVGAMCFENMFPSDWADYATLYVNEVSDRYVVYANAMGSNMEDGYIAVAHHKDGIHGDMVITNEGMTYASYAPDFGQSAYGKIEPVSEEWRMLPFFCLYWNGDGWSRNALGGYYNTAWLCSPTPDFDFVAYGYCPEGSDAIGYVDWGWGPEGERVAMNGQPMFNVGGDMMVLNTHVYTQELTFNNPDGSWGGLYYLQSPFNYTTSMCDMKLGNTVPSICVLNYQYDFGEIFNMYTITDYGRLSEDRTEVDQYMTTVELKIDGETVVAPGESLEEWSWSTDCAQYANSTFDLKVRNDNPLIDDEMPGYAQARIHTDWSTGDTQAPVLTRVLTADIDKETYSDRFAKKDDGGIILAAADFPFAVDPVTEYMWVKPVPCKVEVKYAPHGSTEWSDMPVVAVSSDDCSIPTFGYVYVTQTDGVDRCSADGWFDLAVILTDDAGNFCEEILSPCFNIASMVGIDNVKGKSTASVSGVKGAIVVAGAEGSRAEVYSISGCKVADTTASRIPVQTGVYVVRVNGETFKVAVR